MFVNFEHINKGVPFNVKDINENEYEILFNDENEHA